MTSLSLVSVNIEGSKHLDLVITLLSNRMPDVVCVQELFESDISTLIEVVGAQAHVFAPMAREANNIEKNRIELRGVGIFSRLPIQKSEQHLYKGDGEIKDFDFTNAETKHKTENYIVLSCDIEKDGITFKVATTHFTWTADGSADDNQRRDMRELLHVLENMGEFVLCGDFNAPRIFEDKPGEIFSMLANRYKDNIPANYETSIDGNLHRAGPLPYMIDGLFTTSGYAASHVELHSGVSDHCAITATIGIK